MGKYLGFLSVSLVLSLLCAPGARAYTPTVSAAGIPVRWSGARRLPLAGNPTNQSGIDAASFQAAVVNGLQRWKAASEGAVTFDYWQGTDPAVYEPNSNYNGLSSIYFASNANGQTNLSSNVLGLTQVWYNTDNGQILESDIVLNDVSYHFTTNPRDTSGYGAGGGYTAGRSVFIENVITHELGHAFGLSHSGGLQSTMLFMESPEQAFLGCDEQVGIHAIYPAGAPAARGVVTGRVTVGGAPVFGAHVLAVSRRRGAVLATGVTDRTGSYAIGGLEPGAYFVMAEPYYAGSSALPGFYSGMSANVCSGQPFSRTILSDSGNQPHAVFVPGGGAAAAPDLAVQCGGGGGASLSGSPASASFAGAATIYDGSSGPGAAGGFGVTDRVSYSNTLYYRLHSVSGRVEVHAMGYSLYSPIHPSVTLLDAGGNAVYTDRAENVYSGVSGYVNYDSAVIGSGLPAGDYVVKVTASSLNASVYPAGPVSLDTVPFLVVTGSVNEGDPSLSGTLPFNGRCRMEENFAAYASPPGAPYRNLTASQDDGGGTGFCGTISDRAGGGGGPGPGPGAIAGWLLPWALMGLMARVARRGLGRARGLRVSPAAATL